MERIFPSIKTPFARYTHPSVALCYHPSIAVDKGGNDRFPRSADLRSPSPLKAQKAQVTKQVADRVASFVLRDERAYADP